MGKKLSAFARDARGAATADHVILFAAVIALVIALFTGVRTGTFTSLAEILLGPGMQPGCVTTTANGTTDLSNCY